MVNLKKTILVLALVATVSVGSWMFFRSKKPTQEAFESPSSRLAIDENSYQGLFQGTASALETNSPGNIYKDLSPSIRDLFTYEGFLEGYKAREETDGKVVKVEVVSNPQLKSGGEWEEGKWADGEIRVVREKSSELFLVRMTKEGERWWVFGTIEVAGAN